MIIDAYVRIRTIDNTIPDDVLDFMKNAAIEKVKSMEEHELYLEMKRVVEGCGNWKKDSGHYRSWKYGYRSLNEAYELEQPKPKKAG